MYSRMRYEREREYTVPPRYDGNAFRMYNQSDRLTTGADEVKAAWRRREDAQTHGSAPESQIPMSDSTSDTHERSPFTVDQPPYSSCDIPDFDESEAAEETASGENITVERTESDAERPTDTAVIMPSPPRRSPFDALTGILGRFSYEDALIGAIILVLAGENGSGNEECSPAILALIILLALK